VAELIALGMVTSVGMIESEMGYRAANPFTIHIRFLQWTREIYLALLMCVYLEYLPLGP
jgi:hypothetical protein